MKNKGLIKFFAILFGSVCIFQLVLTFQFNKAEAQAEEYAISLVSDTIDNYDSKRRDIKLNYLDTLSAPVFSFLSFEWTYNDLKKESMKLGLDLKGGINAILQISVKDLLKDLANDSDNEIFNNALNSAQEMQKNSQNTYLEDFFTAFDETKGDLKLASFGVFLTSDLEDEIKGDMSDDEVKGILERKIDESIDAAVQVLRKRVDPDGLLSPIIQRMGNSARISFELPGARDVERIKKLLQGTAQLEFWHALRGADFESFIEQASSIVMTNDSELTEVEQLLGSDEDSSQNQSLLSLVNFDGNNPPVVLTTSPSNRKVISDYLNDDEVKSLLNRYTNEYPKFLWGQPKTNQLGEEYVELYVLKGNQEDEADLNGSVIVDASQQFAVDGVTPTVSMQMNSNGAKKWEEMTEIAYNERSQIAIVLDSIVYSAPGVTSGPISGGQSEISGAFTITEAQDLANVLKAGKLPASAEIIQADEVGPSLGQEAIDSGILSFIIAFILVLIWMIFYYGKAGIYSNIALIFNIILIFGFLAGSSAALTLPGIAGIVLTIGIAVDANVLIYERVREELYSGKKLKIAVADGYQNALSSILDANITTGLVALILKSFGTGPIEGFATTLLIGIITSLFTAIFISKLLVYWDIDRGSQFNFSTYLTNGLFRNMSIDFLKYRKVAYTFSFIIISSGIFSLFTSGLDQGIDFVGGRTYTVRFDKEVIPEEVKKSTDKEFGSSEIKTIGSSNQLKISTKYKYDVNSADIDDEVQEKLYNSLIEFLPEGYTIAQFLDAENDIGKMSSSKVSPTIADDIKKNSFWAVSGSLIVVFFYILFRFRKWQFSLGAVAAVFHDVLIVLGIFSLTYKFMPFSMEIDQAFIAAILTVIGYSLNDTVVVFDRIREFLKDHSTWDFDKTVNSALNSTLSRTLNTSFTTLVVLLSMFTFGADSLRGLIFALIVGVIVGTYSSVFVATPIMKDTLKKYRD